MLLRSYSDAARIIARAAAVASLGDLDSDQKFTVIFATQQIALQSFVHCIIYRLFKTPPRKAFK